ncbi:protein LYRIC isoform X2 [Xenopus laevis]|uniref:Protein LYRIC isoform X2 n=1 Tax=Xenopus laevis TaxID=8355 RepID=A0A8J0VPF3_XENLA|nr:protein LYRIC isoform X2 [Xenopus laevis]
MAAAWQEVAAQQAEEVSARVRQLVSTGLGLLRTELGVDLGLQPQRYPAWVFLALPLILGLFLLFLCASALGRSSAGKKRVREQREAPVQLEDPIPVPKTVKAEDPKKKNKKKPAEKTKPNGRPVELVEEAITTIDKKENQKQPSEAEKKNEKTKKNKKKPKTDAKQPQQSANQDKKESEEGNWETKISNREKRQQRKRDKGTDSDLNISIVETISSVVSEQFSSGPTYSAGTRKSKGTSDNNVINGSGWSEKPSKIHSIQLAEEKWAPSTSAGKKKAEPSTWNQNANDANGKEWGVSWGERPIFPGISAWSNVDGRMTVTEPRQTSFTAMGLNSIPASVTEPISQPATSETQWDSAPNEPCIDDEWSGPNGLNSSDPTSDWNAPAEEWGNCGEEEPVDVPQAEEPEQLTKVSEEEKEESSAQAAASGKTKKKKKKKKQGEESGSAQVSEEEKEESSAQAAASGKTKKKKKKKKQGEESGSAQDTENLEGETVEFQEDKTPAPLQPAKISPAVVVKASEPKKQPEEETRHHNVVTEPSVSVKHSISEKSPSQVQPQQEKSSSNSKQNSVPPPSQAKSEENWESPKQVKKKKKARRET